MGDNLKQHNPNFIVLQSGIGVWLWVIWSNLCTLAQSLIPSRHLNKKRIPEIYSFHHLPESPKSLTEMVPTS